MKRLTERDEYGNADIIGVDSGGLYGVLLFDEVNMVTDALNRLADYEDTGLAPQEIRSLQAEWNAARNLVGSPPVTRADTINREKLISRIYGPERPEINDGAEEVDWIMKCIEEAPKIHVQESTEKNGREIGR